MARAGRIGIESAVQDANENGGGAPTPVKRTRKVRMEMIDDLIGAPPALRKIAILGYTEHRKYAPWHNPEWEIWGLNDLYHEIPDGVTLDRLRWFQIHEWEEQGLRPDSPTDFKAGPPHPRDPNHVAWLKEWAGKGLRLYLMEPRPEVPTGIPLDREAIFAYFEDGTGNAIRYFTNSISWELAVAIMELAPIANGRRAFPGAELAIFGVDMMMGGGQGSEYGWQRPSCEWLIGWARGTGITVHIPKESDLLKTAYQYGDKQGEYFRKRVQSYRNEMSRRRGEASNALQQAQLAHSELTGAINAVDWLLRSHMPGDPGDGSLGRAPVPDSHKGLPAGVSAAEGIADG